MVWPAPRAIFGMAWFGMAGTRGHIFYGMVCFGMVVTGGWGYFLPLCPDSLTSTTQLATPPLPLWFPQTDPGDSSQGMAKSHASCPSLNMLLSSMVEWLGTYFP